MRLALVPSLIAAAALAAACQTTPVPPPEPPPPPFPEAWTVVDLTRPLDADTPVLPHPQGFPFERLPLNGTSGGRVTAAWSATDLLGTHVETPAVFGEGDARVDRIPVAHLLLPTVVIDAPPRLLLPGGETAPPVTGLSAVLAHEARHGTIPHGALIVLRTGAGERSSRELAQAGRTPPGGFDHAGWSLEAVRFLARERRARAIGTDALTLDEGAQVADSPVAREVARVGLIAVAGLANVELLPRRGSVVVLGVIPVAGATAAPARVLAFVPPAPRPGADSPARAASRERATGAEPGR